MDAERLESPATFLEQTGPLLLADEARHNLALGIAGTLRDHPEVYPDFRLWVVRDEDAVVGAALRTVPLGLILVRPSEPAAIEALADAIAEDGPLPTVVGALPEVEEFVRAWTERTGATAHLETAQGIYALEHVVPVEGVPGTARLAGNADRSLLLEWLGAFAEESLPERDRDRARQKEALDHRFDDDTGGLLLWEVDGEPMSLAGYSSPTATGIRVGPVYTPPDRRRKGFASALVAELSRRMLGRGYRFCFLYTDLANPYSNKVYLTIGYEFVCESAYFSFAD